jgi:hypothetical protein
VSFLAVVLGYLAATLSFGEALFLSNVFSLDCIKEGPLEENADLLSGVTRFLKSMSAFPLSCELKH